MSTATTNGVVTTRTIEDWLVFVTPVIVALAGFDWSGVLPGTSAFVTAAVLGALAKFLVGLGQNPHIKNWEDWIPLIVIGLSALATNLSADPRFVTYGLYLGLAVKALPMLQEGLNIEDVLLLVGTLLAGIGQLSGHAQLASLGLVVALVGKTLPSIGTNGEPAKLSITATTSTPAG